MRRETEVVAKRYNTIWKKRWYMRKNMELTWNAGGKTGRPPIAHARRSRDCSYNAGGESVSEEFEPDEGCNETCVRLIERKVYNERNYSHRHSTMPLMSLPHPHPPRRQIRP